MTIRSRKGGIYFLVTLLLSSISFAWQVYITFTLCKQEASHQKCRPLSLPNYKNMENVGGKLPIMAIIGGLGFLVAVLLPLLFLARAAFFGGDGGVLRPMIRRRPKMAFSAIWHA